MNAEASISAAIKHQCDVWKGRLAQKYSESANFLNTVTRKNIQQLFADENIDQKYVDYYIEYFLHYFNNEFEREHLLYQTTFLSAQSRFAILLSNPSPTLSSNLVLSPNSPLEELTAPDAETRFCHERDLEKFNKSQPKKKYSWEILPMEISRLLSNFKLSDPIEIFQIEHLQKLKIKTVYFMHMPPISKLTPDSVQLLSQVPIQVSPPNLKSPSTTLSFKYNHKSFSIQLDEFSSPSPILICTHIVNSILTALDLDNVSYIPGWKWLFYKSENNKEKVSLGVIRNHLITHSQLETDQHRSPGDKTHIFSPGPFQGKRFQFGLEYSRLSLQDRPHLFLPSVPSIPTKILVAPRKPRNR